MLPLLSLLSLLALLSLLTLLLRLIAALQLLHLFLQLLGFAPQHFLLPALPERLLLILLGRQFLLPARQFGQLLQRLVDLLRAAVGSRLLSGFVLVLFAVQFEVGQIFQIAARAARAPPPPPCVPNATWMSRKVASARCAACSAFCSAGMASFHF